MSQDGCPTTRKSTSGFSIIFLGTTVAFGSRTQATIALSSAESELYAICTGVNEGLHLRSYLLETNFCSKLNLRIHTDSTAGKSIAAPQGTSKRAKHIDLKVLYTQDLIKHDISADLFTKCIRSNDTPAHAKHWDTHTHLALRPTSTTISQQQQQHQHQ